MICVLSLKLGQLRFSLDKRNKTFHGTHKISSWYKNDTRDTFYCLELCRVILSSEVLNLFFFLQYLILQSKLIWLLSTVLAVSVDSNVTSLKTLKSLKLREIWALSVYCSNLITILRSCGGSFHFLEIYQQAFPFVIGWF